MVKKSSTLPPQKNPIEMFVLYLKENQLLIPVGIALILLVLTTIFFLLYRRIKQKADTILLIGLSGSGKSTIFGKLINQANEWNTHSSVKENIYTNFVKKDEKEPVKLVDYPGADNFRKTMFTKWFKEARNSLCCVVFTVDSATFSKKDVAEFLYDVLYELKDGKIPVLIACNKQEISHAKSAQLIEKMLEQEFGLINISREAALSLTEGDSSKTSAEDQHILTATGQEFKWTDLKSRPLFVECSTEEDKQQEFSLALLRDMIEMSI